MKREELRQQLRDLIVRDFMMEHKLSNQEAVDLLIEIPELSLSVEILKRMKRAFLDKLKSALAMDRDIDVIRKSGDIFDELEDEART